MDDLFETPPAKAAGRAPTGAGAAPGPEGAAPAPLADRMRPRTLDEIVGQAHLIGPGKLLSETIAGDRVPSMVLWGPPGSGKTTLARVLSRTTKSVFVPFSAVLGGIPELREILAAARQRRSYEGRR